MWKSKKMAEGGKEHEQTGKKMDVIKKELEPGVWFIFYCYTHVPLFQTWELEESKNVVIV